LHVVHSDILSNTEFLVWSKVDTRLRFQLQLCALSAVSGLHFYNYQCKICTLDAATCSVKADTGSGVLFDIRDWIKRVVSVSREMLKRTLTVVLVTVISCEVSGTDEAKSHSSSSFEASALCTKFVVGAEVPPPSRSTAPDAGAGTGADAGGLIDCWYWNGEACRGVEASAAKGSGVREGCGGGVENVDCRGDFI